MKRNFDPCAEAKNTILDLVIALRDDIFTSKDEYNDLMVVEFYFKNFHPEMIMVKFIENVLPYKKQIEKRDVHFFLSNTSIFEGLPPDKIEYYSTVIASGKKISSEYRETIWEYFDSLIALAEMYQKNK